MNYSWQVPSHYLICLDGQKQQSMESVYVSVSLNDYHFASYVDIGCAVPQTLLTVVPELLHCSCAFSNTVFCEILLILVNLVSVFKIIIFN